VSFCCPCREPTSSFRRSDPVYTFVRPTSSLGLFGPEESLGDFRCARGDRSSKAARVRLFYPRLEQPAKIFRSLPNYAWCEMVCSLTSGKACASDSGDPCPDPPSRSTPEGGGLEIAENMSSSLSDAHRRNNNHHLDQGDRSSSAGSSLGSCSPPPASSHSPPPPRPPWLHDFHAAAAPHVLQFLNLSAAGGGMLGSQPLAALHSMAERSHHHQQQQQQQQQQHQQQQHQQQQQQQHQQQQQQQQQSHQQQHHPSHQQQQGGIQLPRITVPPLSTITQGQSSPTGSGKHSPATSITSVGSNPHGIDTILSRPTATVHPQAPVPPSHAGLPPAPHPQHMAAPRYAMHAGFTASSGAYHCPS